MSVTEEKFVSTVSVSDIEVAAEELDSREGLEAAAAKYLEHGCLVVRGLTRKYVAALQRDIEATAQAAIELLPEAKKIAEGWTTPDGTLWLPAPEGFARDKQIMVLPVSYHSSGAFLSAAIDERTVDLVEAILGPNIELFQAGQCLYKEPVGGHPKMLHQDSSYFEHLYEGPVATLNYVVDTNLENGALYVVPGSHRLGHLRHVDTFSHLGLDPQEWSWEDALPIEGKAGDAIFFHYRTIHGSQENHSARARPVFINRYRRFDDYVVVNASTAANREEAEKNRKVMKKSGQKGLMLRGFRPYDPEA
jgi:hypothetical protein